MKKMRSAWLRLGFVILAAASCGHPKSAELVDGGGSVDGGGDRDGATNDGGPLPLSLELLAGDIGGSGNGDGTGAAARFHNPSGVAVDSAGNLYVADADNHTIRKVTAAGVVTTLAGTAGVFGSTDGMGTAARFNGPRGVAVDGAGNVYVADTLNYTIRKVTATGVVTTLAGIAGFAGSADGTGTAARFFVPSGVAVDSAGNVYVADTGNHTIRKITAAGVVTTLAGTAGMVGSADGTGADARFSNPSGVAVDSAGNVYVADEFNHTIRKVTAGGVVTTLAGTAGMAGSADGTGAAARFNLPAGVAVDGAGNVYVADSANDTIRKVTAAGVVTTLAGTAGMTGSADGTGAAARFNVPSGVAVDSAGNVYVADCVQPHHPQGHRRRGRDDAGRRRGHGGQRGRHGRRARFSNAYRRGGRQRRQRLRRRQANSHDPQGHRRRGRDDAGGTAGMTGSTDGTGARALLRPYRRGGRQRRQRLRRRQGQRHDPQGHRRRGRDDAGRRRGHARQRGRHRRRCALLLSLRRGGRQRRQRLRRRHVQPHHPQGHRRRGRDDAGRHRGHVRQRGRHGRRRALQLSLPAWRSTAPATSTSPTFTNDTIRKVTAAGVVTTLAGTAGIAGSADGTGAAARFSDPASVAVDSAGNVYVADPPNATIRKVTPTGTTTTVAGTAGVIGIRVGATPRLSSPQSLAIVGDSLVVSDANAILLLRHGAE